MLPRVIRGDAFEVALKWPKASVDLFVMDPPYGKILKEEWDQTWHFADYIRLETLIDRLLVPGGAAYVWGGIGTPGHRPFFQWLAGIEVRRAAALRIYDLITWRKRRAYGKSDAYLFTREECVMLVKGLKPRVFNIPLLEEKRGYAGYNKDYPAKSEYLRRTNVWTDVTELFKGKIHKAEKPSKLAEIMIETSSRKGDHVVDLFAGSGSTGVAAMKLGRKCTLVEKSNCVMHDFKAVA
jgi:DNA modification methylase